MTISHEENTSYLMGYDYEAWRWKHDANAFQRYADMKEYLEAAIKSFDNAAEFNIDDPPDTGYQKGYLAGLKEALAYLNSGEQA
jgi:hypothetical protein